jgi:hypothetical protein
MNMIAAAPARPPPDYYGNGADDFDNDDYGKEQAGYANGFHVYLCVAAYSDIFPTPDVRNIREINTRPRRSPYRVAIATAMSFCISIFEDIGGQGEWADQMITDR